jgi:oxalate decarboxylase
VADNYRKRTRATPASGPRHRLVSSGAPRTPDAAPETSRAGHPSGKASREPEAPCPEGGGWNANSPQLFHLSNWAPDRFDGGTIRGANDDNWQILRGQEGSANLVRLEPGGVREPHWHPNAWEFNFVISGKARWTVLGLLGEHTAFEANEGDLVFAPRGHYHYFENSGDDDLLVLIVFNASSSEPRNDIGIVASLSVLPPDVLALFMGVSPQVFENMKRRVAPVTIAKRKI